ncbi:MAG: hypothetical protein RIF46_04795, partial [Cyclobacteriaceae bacterium]
MQLQSVNPYQLKLGLKDKAWPDQEKFPLNRENGIQVEGEVFKDLFKSNQFLIITGFTSLSYLIDIFSQYDELSEKALRIVLGFDPILRGRKSWPKRNFPTDIKDYWLEKGISPTKSGGVIHLLQLIENKKVQFRCSERIH